MALNKEIDFCEKISSDVKNTFLQVYNALKNRETQLLRQIEVLAQHYKLNESYDKCFKQVMVIFDNENDILNSVANFGRIDFNGLSCESDVFKIEDYQKPESDHVSLYKYLENSLSEQLNTSNNAKIDSKKLKQLIKENEQEDDITEKLLSEEESIEVVEASNTILECIEKQDPRLCLHVASKSDSNKNKDQVEEDPPTETASTTKDSNGTTSCDINSETANFYSLTSSVSVPNLNCKCNDNSSTIVTVNNHRKDSLLTSSEKNLNDSSIASSEDLHSVSERVRKLSMKQPVQVQQWMEQIISEPEVEPAPNNVMEHSHIKVLRKESV